jgi:hypothetical protein
MNKLSYEEQTRQLLAAIDIAITAFQLYSPKNWDDSIKQHVVKTYLSFKSDVQNPEPKFKNKESLRYSIDEVFTYFQEDSGDAVDYFWQQIKDTGLDFKRENKLVKILKRKKIKTRIEYDFIIDVLVPYQRERLIGNDEVDLLNKLLSDYENSSKE